MNPKTKEWILFSGIMVLFVAGMILLMIGNINMWWVWAIYISTWTTTESTIMKNISLDWWKWALIIVGILSIDVIVLSIIR